jgi:fumarate hydratase class II
LFRTNLSLVAPLQPWHEPLRPPLRARHHPNRERIAELMERSLALVTVLVPHSSYDKAAEVAKRASREGTTLKSAALALGYVTAADYDRWVVPADMIHPDSHQEGAD